MDHKTIQSFSGAVLVWGRGSPLVFLQASSFATDTGNHVAVVIR